MNTVTLENEAKPLGPKQILLTLKKNDGYCHMSPVVTLTEKNKGVKIRGRKIIEVQNFKDGHTIFLKEMFDSDKLTTGDRLRPKITQVTKKNRNTLIITKQCSILKNAFVNNPESKSDEKCSKILKKERKRTDNFIKKPNQADSGDLRNKNLGSNLNKHDRFVPNILRSTKVSENASANNINSVIDSTYDISSHGPDDHSTDKKIEKRKRKQILSPLCIKQVLSPLNIESMRKKRIPRKRNKLDKSSLHIGNNNLLKAKESGTKTVTVTSSNVKSEGINECLPIAQESSATGGELTTVSCDRNNSCTANLDVSNKNQDLPCVEKTKINYTDKSMKTIFDEFQVADYQNYIASGDLGFDIDVLDKLLSSDIDDSFTESSIFHNGTKIMECDVNGNDINALEELNHKYQQCYDHGAEQVVNVSRSLQCNGHLDGICLGAVDCDMSYETARINSRSNELQDYYFSKDLHNFNYTFEESLSSTDIASDIETNKFNSSQSSSFVLSTNEKLDCFSNVLAVSDVVPDNVFGDNSYEFCSESLELDNNMLKLLLDSNPMMKENHVNFADVTDVNDNIRCTSLSVETLDGPTSNSQLLNGLDASLELFEDDNSPTDDMLSMDLADLNKDGTYKRILADSNVEFDDNHVLNMHNNIHDNNIEMTDDIEIPRLLTLGDTVNNHFHFVSLELNPPENELSMETSDQCNPNDIFISNHHDSQFDTRELEKRMGTKAENNLNESELSNVSEDRKFMFENEVETQGVRCFNCYPDIKQSHPKTANVSLGSTEFLSPCHDQINDPDGTKSNSRYLSPLPIEKSDINELGTSKLKQLLTARRSFMNHSNVYHPTAISRSVEIDSNIDKNMDRFRNETNQNTVINLNDDDCIRERRNYDIIELDSPHSEDSHNSKSNSYSASSERSAVSEKVTVKLKRSKRALWQDLIKRSKFVAKNISYIPCPYCERKYRSHTAMNNHMNVVHRFRPPRVNYKHKKYVCDKCSKEYSLAAAMEKHCELHENYILTCKICEKHFSEKVYLQRHIKSYYFRWTIQCDYCSRKFPKKNVLTRHLKHCHGIPEFWPEV